MLKMTLKLGILGRLRFIYRFLLKFRSNYSEKMKVCLSNSSRQLKNSFIINIVKTIDDYCM